MSDLKDELMTVIDEMSAYSVVTFEYQDKLFIVSAVPKEEPTRKCTVRPHKASQLDDESL